MEIKILSPLWGYDHIPLEDMLEKIATAGYDGIDAWLPEDEEEKKTLLDFVKTRNLCLVLQQHQAEGATFGDFKKSFRYHLERCAAAEPAFINSHTGKDFFTFDQNLELIDLAQQFSKESGITVLHETHRGRFGYSPSVMAQYFNARRDLQVTADISHWVCVTESWLENFSAPLGETFLRTRHIHARVGYEEGPQVPDPRAPEWKPAAARFFQWWDQIAKIRAAAGEERLTFTTEFGPPPYLQTVPFKNKPVADQFEINCYMKDRLAEHYSAFRV